MKRKQVRRKTKLATKYPGIEYGRTSDSVIFDPVLKTRGISSWLRLKKAVLRRKETEKRGKKRPRDKEKEAEYFPKIHLDEGPDAWYTTPTVTRDGGQQKFYITNNGLRTSSLIVLETYEAELGIYGVPLGDPYVAVLNNRGLIKKLHPGETKTLQLQWNPDTSQLSTHLIVAAYDPILDPRMPLNYHPSLFPNYHIKTNGHAVFRV